MPKILLEDKQSAAHWTPAVHLSPQGKGVIASFLAHFYKSRGADAISVHTDPTNPTISQYAALGAQHLLKSILGSDESFIVDNGASTFIPLWHYLVESGAASVLRETNRKLAFTQSRLDEIRSCRIS